MSWQPVPRIDQSGAYGDPFAMHAGGGAPQIMPSGLSAEEQHFFSSCTTREYEEMARRKAEHMESAEHIAPQHNYPMPGKTSRSDLGLQCRPLHACWLSWRCRGPTYFGCSAPCACFHNHSPTSLLCAPAPRGEVKGGHGCALSCRAQPHACAAAGLLKKRFCANGSEMFRRVVRARKGSLKCVVPHVDITCWYLSSLSVCLYVCVCVSVRMYASRLNEKVLRDHFHLPLSEVAKKFGMCTTAFKKLCRKQGVMQWPHRTLRSLEKKIASLRAEQKFTNDHNQIDEQVRKLQMKREAILSGTGLTNLESDDLLGASPSDDSSSTACSGSSSPRTHDVLNALALDDSSSVGSSSSLHDERHGSSTGTSSAGSLSARGPREGGSVGREGGALEYPQMPGEGMLSGDKGGGGGPWDKRFRMHPSGGHVAPEERETRDPFDTPLPHGHEAPNADLMHRMRGLPLPGRGGMHAQDGNSGVAAEMADRHEAHRRGAPPGGHPFASGGGLGMHPQMTGDMHMRGGGGRFGVGMMPAMGGGFMGSHMSGWGGGPGASRDPRDHMGSEGLFYPMGAGGGGMPADDATSNARLQQQVSYLLAENHNLRLMIRSLSKERDDYARKSDGAGQEISNYKVLCSQLEAQINHMNDQRGTQGGVGGAHGRHDTSGASSKEDEQERRQLQAKVEDEESRMEEDGGREEECATQGDGSEHQASWQ